MFAGVDQQTGRAVELVELPLVRRPDLAHQVEAWQQADSPHLVNPLALLEDEGFLVQEEVPGSGLHEHDAALPLGAGLALSRQLARGLGALHAQGVMHGSVRAPLVKLGPRGAALVLDVEPAVGVPGETAPECAGLDEGTVAADLYGLGTVMGAVLTGRPVFAGATDWARLGAQQRGERATETLPAGVSALLDQLVAPSPAARPSSALDVLQALERLEERPDKARGPARRWLAPVRPGGAWAVVGQDPATGGQATMATGLSRRKATRLRKRLQALGWDVRAVRVALGGRQVLMAMALTLVCGVVLPGVGAAVGLVLGWWVGSTGARPELVETLPTTTTPLPPRRLPDGTESAFAAGLLLLATVPLMLMGSELVWIPLVCLVWVIWAAFRARPKVEPPEVGRVRAVLAAVRAELEGRELPLEDELALLGEAEMLSTELERSRNDPDDLLGRAEVLLARSRRLPQSTVEPHAARLRGGAARERAGG